MFIKLLV